MDEHDEQDRYVAQLQEVFNSCDPNGSGYLDRQGITLLCQQLQLDEQAPFFLQHLIKDDPHPLINFNEFKDEFISLLTQSIGQLGSPQNVASPEREISPKYVHGNKKYGRRSQPESQEFDSRSDAMSSDLSDSEVFYNESLSRTLSPNVTLYADSEVMDHDGYPPGSSFQNKNSKTFTKRKRRSNSDSVLYPSSHKDENEPEYLRDVWKTLAVGSDGFLDLLELERVCEHIGMEKMSQEVVSQLFAKLDTDQDGKISFEEFMNVFQNGDSGSQTLSLSATNIAKNIQGWSEKTNLLDKSCSAVSQDERCETTISSTSGSGMFSSLDPENTGMATFEAVVDLWESLGFPNVQQILKDFGFTSSSSVNLQDLSNNLEEMLVTCEDPLLRQIAAATMNFQIKYQKNQLEQLKIERNKLKADVSEANLRATLLAQEIDDQNAKLEKSSQNRIIMLEKKHKDQIQSLVEEHLMEKEQLSAQMIKVHQTMETQIKRLQEEECELQEKLENHQKENTRLSCEVRELTEKLEESEKLNQRYKKDLESLFVLKQRSEELESGEMKYQSMLTELESLKLENQKLRDCNDELVLKVESLQQQLASRPSSRSSSSHKRNGSWLGEYVPNPAVKRRGASSTSCNLHESQVDYNLRFGKIYCKSPDLPSEENGNQMDQLEDPFDVP